MWLMSTEFDLNLVRTFVLLYERRSVTATARALHVTQPTVSYSLQKLRRRLHDELFLRGARGLVPTARAVALYDPLRESLTQIDLSVASERGFDASTSTSHFSIALSDLGELSLLPRMLDAMLTSAPYTRLTVLPLDMAEAEGQLSRGEIDAFIASPVIQSGRITRLPLFSEPYLGVVRGDHPRITGTTVTREQVAAERLVGVTGHSGHVHPVRAIHTEGLGRHVLLELTRFAALPNLLAGTDLVGFVPRNVAEVFADSHDLRLFALPWHVDAIEVALYTRHPHARSPAQTWLAGLIIDRLSGLA
jgi:DNA-binding transcriptional LysR family regulator